MEVQERRLYTKNCLKLLGYECITPDDRDFRIYRGYNDNLPESIDANFNSGFITNWSWIMTIVEAIEALDLSKKGYSWESDVEIKYNNEGISVEITNTNCIIYQNLALDPIHVYASVEMDTKKKAVVYAISDFLKLLYI